ncbi:cytochrome b/b6 domain-containing protein [Microbacterium sp. 11MF]|uniref:cytochrome b/b6 domain-containing protein n=1 Tax=Microbacterium sp. 11MF TaxID=1169146 RepID=UPI000381392E|nr:cytochrome b/b6 domain-containing protein [Microbacterium sp. 11MF]
MATYARSVRRGLPRASGGDPWPPAGAAPAPAAVAPTPVDPPATVDPPVSVQPTETAPTGTASMQNASARGAATRRGLPRTPGGEAWPPAASTAPDAAPPAVPAVENAPREADGHGADPVLVDAAEPAASTPVASTVAASTVAASAAAASADDAGSGAVRRGLPRAAGGDAWPPAETTPAPRATPPSRETARGGPDSGLAPQSRSADAVSASSEPKPAAPAAPAAAPAAPATPRAPLAERPLAHAGVARRPAAKPDPARIGPFTKVQWAGVVVLGGAAVLYVAAMAVLAVRWILSLEPLQDFLTTYPGEYHLPEGAPVGFPVWLNWSHFLNAFFIVLIIRTGLQVRSEKRPAAFWISKKDRKRRMSLTLWLHQALDVLWLANGVIFVVLLFVTGQWMRVIPTSWEVFPNAVSAALQYVSLDWPTENGWVNYNALQQLAYFATIFIAAPLAAITGYRMSAVWPKQATTLNRIYPVEWARKIHFPTMLYFVLFIVVHVALVLSTGALRNLGHMYAATGSTDPEAYADNWTGFWLFALSIAVTVAAYVAMRPLVVAPIARLFGEVKSR